MLGLKSLKLTFLRTNSNDLAKGLKFGGFRDPWWAGSRLNPIDKYEIPGKEKDKFPFVNDMGGPYRPLK
jgi:hypothetical protein